MFAAIAASVMLGSCATPAAVRSPSSGATRTPAATGATTDYPRLEREVLSELNVARGNPTAYARTIQALLPYYNGTLLKRPDASVPVRTVEGARAAREAIAALKSQPSVPPVTASAGLAAAARDLASDQGRTGRVGHTGSDGSTPLTRIARYGKWSVTTDENVGYGPFVRARDVVQDLIIDDGVADRGHRRNIFDPRARVVGVACGPHPVYKTVCVIDQAAAFTSK